MIGSRDSEDVAKVLEHYCNASTITRDRGKCFDKAIGKALPTATVVTDKFHVMENLTKAAFPQVQRHFLRERKRLLDRKEVGPKPPTMNTSWILQGIYASLESMSKDARLYQWINMAVGCGVDGVEKFARGLLDDYQAIKNSITSKWNNGILEGFVCKIKTAKRIMGGRASIPLLERKVVLRI